MLLKFQIIQVPYSTHKPHKLYPSSIPWFLHYIINFILFKILVVVSNWLGSGAAIDIKYE